MHIAIKLLTGIAATVVVTRAGTLTLGGALMAKLSGAAADALAAERVIDGSVSFRASNGIFGRVARVSGTADAGTRARVLNRLRQHPGIVDARWAERRPGS